MHLQTLYCAESCRLSWIPKLTCLLKLQQQHLICFAPPLGRPREALLPSSRVHLFNSFHTVSLCNAKKQVAGFSLKYIITGFITVLSFAPERFADVLALGQAEYWYYSPGCVKKALPQVLLLWTVAPCALYALRLLSKWGNLYSLPLEILKAWTFNQ